MKERLFSTHEQADRVRNMRTAEEQADQAASDLTTARAIIANRRSSQYDQIWARRIVARLEDGSPERVVYRA